MFGNGYGAYEVLKPTPGLGNNALPTTLVATMPSPVVNPATIRRLSPIPMARPALPAVATLRALPMRAGLVHVLVRLRQAPVQKKISLLIGIPAMAAPPVLSTLQAAAPKSLVAGKAQITFTEHEGLWIVSDAPESASYAATSGYGQLPNLTSLLPKGTLAQAPSGTAIVLGTMTFALDPGQDSTAPQVTGKAIFVAGQVSGNAWQTVQAMNQAGYAALIEKASVPTGTFNLVFTKDPGTVAQLAGGDSASHALLTEDPQDVVAGALAALHGGTVPASVQSGAKPAWLVPVLVGAGALVLGVLLFRKKKATPNPKRKRRLGPRYAKVCVCEKRVVNPRRRRRR